MKDLIEEAERWDLEPNPASLWWTSSCTSEKKMDLTIGTKTGHHRVPFEEFFKIRGFSLNRQGKTHEGIEERMQSANKDWWRDAKIYRSNDVSWRVKCSRMVEHLYSVFCFGGENWSWTLDRIKAWETKAMKHLVRFKEEEEDEVWAAYCTRTARVARKIWTKMKLPFL